VHADPRQDVPPVLLALGARVAVASRDGAREIPVDDFFLGFMETEVGEDELVTSVFVPAVDGRRAVYARFTPTSSDDFPAVGVAVSIDLDVAGAVSGVRVALGGVADTPILVSEAGDVLVGRRPGERDLRALADAASESARPSGDSRGSPAYKK